MSLIPGGSEDRRYGQDGLKRLLATMTFKVNDSMWVCVDTCLWPPSSKIAFSRSDAKTYIPRMSWKNEQGEGIYCDHIMIPENQAPICDTTPSDMDINTTGSFTTGTFSAYDPFPLDGTITGVSAYVVPAGSGITGLVVNAGSPANRVSATVTFSANHCSTGVYQLCVVFTDNGNLSDTCCIDVELENNPPVCTPPANFEGPYDELMTSTAFSCTDPDGDLASMAIIGVDPVPCANSPYIDGNVVKWDGECCDVSIPYTVTLQCTDVCGLSAAPQTFTVHFTNAPPTIVCPTGPPKATRGDQYVSLPYNANDPEGQPYVVAVTGITPAPTTSPDPFVEGGVVKWDVASDEVCEIYTIELTVTDECLLTSTCTFDVEVLCFEQRPNLVWIPNTVYQFIDPVTCVPADTHACVNPGDMFEIPIMLSNFGDSLQIGGFEFELEFDYLDLTFMGAERGCLLKGFATEQNKYGEWVEWSWEYFTYRLLPCPLCACCKYKILFYGQSDQPNGPLFLGYCLGVDSVQDALGDWHYFDFPINGDLVWMKFVVANNALLRGYKLPICFEWEHKLSTTPPYHIVEDWDCAENTMSNCDGNDLFVSSDRWSLVWRLARPISRILVETYFLG